MRASAPFTNSHRIRVSNGRYEQRQLGVTDRSRRRQRHYNCYRHRLTLVLTDSENKSLYIAEGCSKQPKSCHIIRNRHRKLT